MDAWRPHDRARRAATPTRRCRSARETHVVRAPADGFLTRLDAYAVGRRRLAPGRRPGPQGGRRPGGRRRGDARQARAPGAAAGEPLLTLHTDTPEHFDAALRVLEGGYEIAPEGSRPTPARSSSTASPDRTRAHWRSSSKAGSRRRTWSTARAGTRPEVLDGQRRRTHSPGSGVRPWPSWRAASGCLWWPASLGLPALPRRRGRALSRRGAPLAVRPSLVAAPRARDAPRPSPAITHALPWLAPASPGRGRPGRARAGSRAVTAPPGPAAQRTALAWHAPAWRRWPPRAQPSSWPCTGGPGVRRAHGGGRAGRAVPHRGDGLSRHGAAYGRRDGG